MAGDSLSLSPNFLDKESVVGKVINILNKRFSRWTVISKSCIEGSLKPRWICRCDCGTIKIVSSNNLRSGSSKSCGCLNRDKLSIPESPFNCIVNMYKQSAKRRNLDWALTAEEVNNLFKANCYYCGIEPHKIRSTIKYHYTYNGIDRKDNNIGYTYSNCVSCCYECNVGKSNKTEFDFMKWIERVYRYNYGGSFS